VLTPRAYLAYFIASSKGNAAGLRASSPRCSGTSACRSFYYKVECESKSKRLKSGFHFIGSRVETRRFQALWVNWIQLVQTAPTVDHHLVHQCVR
jgi:hypothetical protein